MSLDFAKSRNGALEHSVYLTPQLPQGGGMKAPHKCAITDDVKAKKAREARRGVGNAREVEEWLTCRAKFTIRRGRIFVCARNDGKGEKAGGPFLASAKTAVRTISPASKGHKGTAALARAKTGS